MLYDDDDDDDDRTTVVRTMTNKLCHNFSE